MKRGVALTVAVLWIAMSGAAAAQQVAREGTRQSMDVVVTRHVEDANGKRIGLAAETVRYRVMRIKTSTGWRTVMTIGAPDGASREAMARNPFFGGRVEIDEAGTLAMFDNAGTRIALPSKLRVPSADLLRGEWSQSLDGFYASPQQRKVRMADVERRYGGARGTVRGLAQYIRRNGESMEELLVDGRFGVPRELNVMQRERLTGRMLFDYVERPGRGIVRRGVRAEALVNDQGDRAVTTTEFSSVATTQERER